MELYFKFKIIFEYIIPLILCTPLFMLAVMIIIDKFKESYKRRKNFMKEWNKRHK